MAGNYEIIEKYVNSEYDETVLIRNQILDFEISNVQEDHEYTSCNTKQELEYYQKLIDSKKQREKADNKNSSILMIIPVKRRIPYIKPCVSFDFEVAVLDFRHMYRLRWNCDVQLDELSNLLDALDNDTLLEVCIDRYRIFYSENAYLVGFDFRSYKDRKTTKKLDSFNYNSKVSEICQKLFTKSIFELRITTPIDSNELIKLIIGFLSIFNDTEQATNCELRDLELCIQSTGDTKTILEALSKNYMIKTVRIISKSKENVDEETEELAENFKKSRIGTEVRISSGISKFKKSKVSSIEVFYPDAI